MIKTCDFISLEHCTPENAVTSEPRVRELKGAHYLTLQQQYGLMLATYKEPPAAASLRMGVADMCAAASLNHAGALWLAKCSAGA